MKDELEFKAMEIFVKNTSKMNENQFKAHEFYYNKLKIKYKFYIR